MPESPAAASWITRIPAVFGDHAAEILRELGVLPLKTLGTDYHLVRLSDPAALQGSGWASFVPWNLPVHHAWPCCPQKMEGFVEKAAQGIFRRFSGSSFQALFTGPLQTGAVHPYYKHLAVNLRGRALQLFPPLPVREPEEQDPAAATLFCLVGKEGLYCGLHTPRTANGFYPGGTKFISRDQGISRAGAKAAEALHYLRLHRAVPPAGTRWLELGASPGGMTAELLARGYRVTAVDRAAMDARLQGREGLEIVRADADAFQPAESERFGGLLCDMNGDARASLRQVVRLASWLETGAPVIFTLKGAGAESPADLLALREAAAAFAAASGLVPLAGTHLSSNRHELTLFFEKENPHGGQKI